MAVPTARQSLDEQMAPGIAAALEGLGQTGDEVAADPSVVVRSVPAGYEVDSYSDQEAVVDVWATVIFFAEGRQALGDVWTTQRVTVQWHDGDWRLASFSVADGPVPPETADPSASGVAASINNFDEFVAVPVPE